MGDVAATTALFDGLVRVELAQSLVEDGVEVRLQVAVGTVRDEVDVHPNRGPFDRLERVVDEVVPVGLVLGAFEVPGSGAVLRGVGDRFDVVGR